MPDQTIDLADAREAVRQTMTDAVSKYLAAETKLATELANVKAQRVAMEKTLAAFDAPAKRRRGRPRKDATTNEATANA